MPLNIAVSKVPDTILLQACERELNKKHKIKKKLFVRSF